MPPVLPARGSRGNRAGAPRAGASCPANTRETQIGFGYVPQADVATANVLADIWSMTKNNSAMGVIDLTTEDNADDIGKGDEFPTINYPTTASTAVPIEKYTSSEFAAWAFLFGLGNGTKSGTAPGALTYVAEVSDPAVDCINVPAFTYIEQIRPGANYVVDHDFIGMCVNDFTLTLESGPGRNNCRMVVNCLGTGRMTVPSGIVLPALTPEHLLNATAATTLTINGIDYLLGGNFISLEFRYTNNIRTDSGYYPGSGSQNGFAVRGRMEYNKREFTLNFVARAQKGSVELNNLTNQTEGSVHIVVPGATIGLGPATHEIDILLNRTVISAYTTGDADGLVTVNCSAKIMKPTTATPMVQLTAVTTQDGIFGL